MVDEVNIASVFAEFFAKAYFYNGIERSSQLKYEYNELRNGYIGSIFTDEYLLIGKAPGLDNLTAEHLIHSHSALTSILVKLFNIIY